MCAQTCAEHAVFVQKRAPNMKPRAHHAYLLTLELGQYRKIGSMFFSSEPVAARGDCRRLGNALCLCSPVQPAQAEPEQELGR